MQPRAAHDGCSESLGQSRPRHEFLIPLEVGLRLSAKVEFAARCIDGLHPHVMSELAARQKLCESICQRSSIAWAHEKPGLRVGNLLRDAADGSRHDGRATSESF